MHYYVWMEVGDLIAHVALGCMDTKVMCVT